MYLPFTLRHWLRRSLNRIVETPARLAAGAAASGNPLARAYHASYVRRRFEPLRPLLPSGALVFDVGANAGLWTAALRSLDCRVVAVEPQAACVALLTDRFADDPLVAVVAAAVSQDAGELELFLAGASEHATTSPHWMDDMVARAGFDRSYWPGSVVVPVGPSTT